MTTQIKEDLLKLIYDTLLFYADPASWCVVGFQGQFCPVTWDEGQMARDTVKKLENEGVLSVVSPPDAHLEDK